MTLTLRYYFIAYNLIFLISFLCTFPCSMPNFKVIKCEEIAVVEVKKNNRRKTTMDRNVLIVSHQDSSSIPRITPREARETPPCRLRAQRRRRYTQSIIFI